MMRGVVLAGWLALAAAPAAAQEAAPAVQPSEPQPASPSDPIGDLLAQQAAALPDPEETGRDAAPARDRTVRPVTSPTLSGEAYDRRIRASMAAAQGYQGPLDGGWTLRAAEGELFALQLVDRGAGRPVEGAWRDLKHPGAPDSSGFIDEVQRAGADVTLRFGTKVAVLHAAGGDRLAGELTDGERRQTVTLIRRP